MESQHRVKLLVVLTLLQLCRAEIKHSEPQWYSANIINDAFQPKSIAELFTTEPPSFSTANPIIVSSSSDDVRIQSTPAPPTSFSSSTLRGFSTSTTPFLPSSSFPVIDATFNHPLPTGTTQSQELQFAFSQDPQTSLGSSSSTPQSSQNAPPQPNYFLIYQHAPQSIQSSPNLSSSPQTTAGGGFTTASPVTSTFSTTFSSPPTFSTMRTVPITMRTSPVFSTPSTPVTQQSTVAVTVTPSSTIGSSTPSNVRLVNCVPQPATPVQRVGFDGIFPLKIRVVAPSGSITNVNFNARTQAPLTTQSTTRTTTTRRPTTRRTPKPRKNTYERCLQGCRKNGQNLCAAPLSQSPVDPSTLRGFPSVCHMACHNSYRKNPYEKIVDGSCGKLRTRIRPVDSNSKLKRDELNRMQYFLDNSGQPAIVEFSGAYA